MLSDSGGFWDLPKKEASQPAPMVLKMMAATLHIFNLMIPNLGKGFIFVYIHDGRWHTDNETILSP